MSDAFYRQLDLPEPDVHLGVGSASHAVQTARIMEAFEPVIEQESPNLLLVVGDVNSTLACSLVAAKRHVDVAHIEAGLRSFDRRIPEEINRILTDQLCDLLFVTEESGRAHLRAEGVEEDRIHFVGNVMVDSLVAFREKAASRPIRDELRLTGLEYILMTMHRPANVHDRRQLLRVVELMEELPRCGRSSSRSISEAGEGSKGTTCRGVSNAVTAFASSSASVIWIFSTSWRTRPCL